VRGFDAHHDDVPFRVALAMGRRVPVTEMRETRFMPIWCLGATMSILVIAALVTAVVATSGRG
jgi:hypothetical protein